MKTKLIFLVSLIVCFSCSQKERIENEAKYLVNTFNKGCEEVNPELIIHLFHPDFVYISNGKILNYQESVDTAKHLFAALLNQKHTVVSEDYIVLDNSTVLYTANTKWTMNFRNGRSVLQNPRIIQLLFKKVDFKWRIISFVESCSEKNLKPGDTAN